MAELNAEQLSAAEGMSLDELRALALKESAEPTLPAKEEQPRGEDGKFAAADGKKEDEVIEDTKEAGEPTTTIFRKEIENGNGSVDVYEADSLEELVEKLATAKLNANKKIQEFISEKKASAAQTQQVSADDEYVIGEKLKKNPKATMKEVVAEVIEERATQQAELAARIKDAQEHFVSTHPDYIPNPENGNRLIAWLKANGLQITRDGLEKGYQDLKSSRLLELKTEGAGGATEAKDGTTQQTAETQSDATQQRSSKKGSTVSVRNGSRTTAAPNTQPSEDDLYSMPIEKLKDLANKQLADKN